MMMIYIPVPSGGMRGEPYATPSVYIIHSTLQKSEKEKHYLEYDHNLRVELAWRLPPSSLSLSFASLSVPPSPCLVLISLSAPPAFERPPPQRVTSFFISTIIACGQLEQAALEAMACATTRVNEEDGGGG